MVYRNSLSNAVGRLQGAPAVSLPASRFERESVPTEPPERAAGAVPDLRGDELLNRHQVVRRSRATAPGQTRAPARMAP